MKKITVVFDKENIIHGKTVGWELIDSETEETVFSKVLGLKEDGTMDLTITDREAFSIPIGNFNVVIYFMSDIGEMSREVAKETVVVERDENVPV